MQRSAQAGRSTVTSENPVTQLTAVATKLADEFAGSAADHDSAASFPFANFTRLFDAGLLALTVPRALGGLGGGLGEAIAVIREIGRGRSPNGSAAKPSRALR